MCLNEIEVYTTADTYENYAQNIVPYGYTAANAGFWVSEGVGSPTGHESKRALYLSDSDATDKTITKTVSATSTKTLEFWIRTKAFAASGGAIQWRLMFGATNVFRLRVVSGGQISWYNGTAYTNIGGANVIPLDTWKLVKVVANASTNQASLYVDGVLIGAANAIGEQGTGAATMNGLLFSSGGAAATGAPALFDDVSLN